jgi:hypothetical protein
MLYISIFPRKLQTLIRLYFNNCPPLSSTDSDKVGGDDHNLNGGKIDCHTKDTDRTPWTNACHISLQLLHFPLHHAFPALFFSQPSVCSLSTGSGNFCLRQAVCNGWCCSKGTWWKTNSSHTVESPKCPIPTIHRTSVCGLSIIIILYNRS